MKPGLNTLELIGPEIEEMFRYFRIIHGGEPPLNQPPGSRIAVAELIAREWARIFAKNPRLTSVQAHRDALAANARQSADAPERQDVGDAISDFWIHVAASVLTGQNAGGIDLPAETMQTAIAPLRRDLEGLWRRFAKLRPTKATTWIEFAPYGEPEAVRIGWLYLDGQNEMLGVPFEARDGGLMFGGIAGVLSRRTGSAPCSIALHELDAAGGLGRLTESAYWQYRFLEGLCALELASTGNCLRPAQAG